MRPGELAAFVHGLVVDTRLAHADAEVIAEIPWVLDADFDPDRMTQVVSNLLSNACKHGVLDEAVWVRLAVKGSSVELSMSNMAPPIEAGRIDSLFDPFKQEFIGNVRNPGGLGLGLYIASEVAKGHGGQLEYSHDGTRVCFVVTFPQFADKDPKGVAPVESAPALRGIQN